MVDKKRRRAVGTAIGLTGLAVTTSVGASVVTKAGGSAAGLTTFSSFAPALGALGGAGVVLSSLRGLQPSKRKRRR